MIMFRTKKKKITFGKIVRALVSTIAILVLGLVAGYVIYTQPTWVVILILAVIFLMIVFFLKGFDFWLERIRMTIKTYSIPLGTLRSTVQSALEAFWTRGKYLPEAEE